MKIKTPVLLLLLFVACNTTAPPLSSKEKLKKEKMVAILLDVHLFESSFNLIDRNKEDADSIMAKEYALIFKKNDIKEEDFLSTYNYYIANPALLDFAYDELVTQITTLQSQLLKQPQQKLAPDIIRYKDSLKNQMHHRLKAHKKQ